MREESRQRPVGGWGYLLSGVPGAVSDGPAASGRDGIPGIGAAQPTPPGSEPLDLGEAEVGAWAAVASGWWSGLVLLGGLLLLESLLAVTLGSRSFPIFLLMGLVLWFTGGFWSVQGSTGGVVGPYVAGTFAVLYAVYSLMDVGGHSSVVAQGLAAAALPALVAGLVLYFRLPKDTEEDDGAGPLEVSEQPVQYDLASAGPALGTRARWEEADHRASERTGGIDGPPAATKQLTGVAIPPMPSPPSSPDAHSASPHLEVVPGVPALPEERVLHRWSAPGGVGVLTDLRVLLLGHPKPRRRKLRWTADLRRIRTIEVEGQGGPSTRVEEGGRRGSSRLNLDDQSYAVLVDNMVVYRGPPSECQKVQAWISGAWADRLRLAPQETLR